MGLRKPDAQAEQVAKLSESLIRSVCFYPTCGNGMILQARGTKQNKTVQKQMEVLTKTEELLTNALKDDQKKWFLDLANAWGIVNGESNLDSFIMGFCLGANFAFIATETPFEDLLKE